MAISRIRGGGCALLNNWHISLLPDYWVVWSTRDSQVQNTASSTTAGTSHTFVPMHGGELSWQ